MLAMNLSLPRRVVGPSAAGLRPRGAVSARATNGAEPTRDDNSISTAVPEANLELEQPPEALNMPFNVLAGISSAGLGLTDAGSCSDILDSAYAQVLGVPLPLLGAVGYGSIAAVSLYSLVLKSSNGAADPDPAACRQLATNGKLVLYASSILAGTSAALAITLRLHFPDTFCAYCTASIVASLSLFFTAFTFTVGSDRAASAATSATMAVALLALYSTYPDVSLARDIDLDYTSPVVTDVSKPGAADLAARLNAAGAKFYGAFWCSHCFEQKQLFGSAAVKDLPYVECYPSGYHGTSSIARACTDANVQNFPTWVINGQTVEGDWPLEYLAGVLDGADPKEEAKKF